MSEEKSLSRLDSIAQEIKFKSERLAMDMVDIGKSLTEAKGLVPHGEWKSWVENNTPYSARTAQVMMQAADRFGQSPSVAALGWSKIVPMLSLPEGTEDEFLEVHDVSEMSAREVRQAVKEVNQAKKETPAPEIPSHAADDGMAKEMEELRAQLKAANDANHQLAGQYEILFKEKQGLQKDKDMLNDQIKNAVSFPTMQDDERAAGFQVEDWIIGVAEFISKFANLPYAHGTFAAMKYEEKKAFYNEAEHLQTWISSVMDAAKTEAIAI